MMDDSLNSALAEMLVRCGLLLSGDFAQSDGSRSRYLLRLDLLASYPVVLDALAVALAERVVQGDYSRILCPFDALPLGTAVALRTHIPLVYSRGTQDVPVVDLVGAYDIGHRTLLVVNRTRTPGMIDLVRRARTVGLDVLGAAAVLAEGDDDCLADIPCIALLHTSEVLSLLHLREDLPGPSADASA